MWSKEYYLVCFTSFSNGILGGSWFTTRPLQFLHTRKDLSFPAPQFEHIFSVSTSICSLMYSSTWSFVDICSLVLSQQFLAFELLDYRLFVWRMHHALLLFLTSFDFYPHLILPTSSGRGRVHLFFWCNSLSLIWAYIVVVIMLDGTLLSALIL